LTESDRKALHIAALFKDLSLAFLRHEGKTTGRSTLAAVREYLNIIWKSLSSIPSFSTACNFILYRWETYDGTGGTFGIKGADIPLGSRILAIADTYHRLTSEPSPHVKITPETAMQKIVENAGLCFDPRVVNAFLMLWKRNEMKLVPAEN
jgi:HD-GYP domain-containing protein (c-di-GMP phosphodiesterase class II)